MTKLEWDTAPTKTQWGVGMKEAIVELSKDEILNLYVHEDAIPLVMKALEKLCLK